MEIEKEEYFNENPDLEAQEEYLEEFGNIKNKNTNMISKYSNIYVNDIEDFFVALIFMGYTDYLIIEIIGLLILFQVHHAKILLWKFECLQKFIHTYPGDSVSKNKILPLTKEILKNSRKYYTLSTFDSIYERIISF